MAGIHWLQIFHKNIYLKKTHTCKAIPDKEQSKLASETKSFIDSIKLLKIFPFSSVASNMSFGSRKNFKMRFFFSRSNELLLLRARHEKLFKKKESGFILFYV